MVYKKRSSKTFRNISSYGKQDINKSDINSVVHVLKSDFLTQGPAVSAFETALAKYCGARYAVAVDSGTAALHLSYIVSGIGEGDEVITTPNTFVATTNMLIALGARPVFCDIRLDTYNIDENKIESLITQKTKAIVPVHFAGNPCEMDVIMKIARKHDLKVIEDASHALGASYKGKKVGGFETDMATFSFHPVKSITTAEGGAIVTNNKEYYERLSLLRSHGIHKDRDGTNVMTELGYNYRMPDVLATLGVSQLKRLSTFIKRRRKVAEWYEEELGDVDGIVLPKESNESSWHIYVIRTKDPSNRKPLRDYLSKKGIGVNLHYPAVYAHPYYREHGYKNTALKNMDVYHSTCITLPCHVHLERSDVEYIGACIKKYFNE